MRRIQLGLAVVLTLETVALIYQAQGFVARMTATSDGTVVPSPWLFPSIFSGGLALLVGVLFSSYLILLAHPTKLLLVGSIVVFIVANVGLWSLHRAIVSVESVGHGWPAWW